MNYRVRTTGDVYSEPEIRSLHPNVSLPVPLRPEDAAGLGLDPVYEGVQPVPVPPYEYVQSDGIEQVDGQWVTRYVVATMTPEQAVEADSEQAGRIRAERNQRLTDCDWTQLPDAPVDPAPWATYRQALRDISAQAGFPWDVTWPEVP